MANTNSKRTLKDLEQYRSTHAAKSQIKLALDDDLIDGGIINLSMITAQQYIDACDQWIEEIVKKIDTTISDKTSLRRRDVLIQDTFNLSVCREYGHMVESICLDGLTKEDDGIDRDSKPIVDRISIATLLSEYSSIPEFSKQIIKGALSFIEENTITHVGIPPHTCSKCKQLSVHAEPGKPLTLIPLNPITTFFTLRNLKLQRSTLQKAQG